MGAGVVGLAVARSLAMTGRDVIVVESEPEIGMHSSSRNSEVIHAGLYYDRLPLKATMCVTGKELLYRYCRDRNIAHRRIGKLIVASGCEGRKRIHSIEQQAISNGVADVRVVDQVELRELEPELENDIGLFSPSTGIIDSHELMLTLRGDIEAAGGFVLTNSRFVSPRSVQPGIEFELAGDASTYSARTVINCAGLRAPELAAALSALPDWLQPGFAKGHYFSYQMRSPFRHLVYPLPVNGGLGIHVTLDTSGAVRFGPDVEWTESIDYGFDESRKDAFVDAIREYYPGLDASRLVPGYTGLRAKLTAAKAAPADFIIEFESDHGVPGLVNLLGIESPGLTSCLAIAEYVSAAL